MARVSSQLLADCLELLVLDLVPFAKQLELGKERREGPSSSSCPSCSSLCIQFLGPLKAHPEH
jgi:hypothetical protein